MKEILKPLFIFSVYQADKTQKKNEYNHKATATELRRLGIGHKEVMGRYKGTDEQSFVVDADAFQVVDELATDFKQESYIFLDEQRYAYLMIVGDRGRGTKQGTFKGVNEFVAMNSDGWTYCPDLDQFYTIN